MLQTDENPELDERVCGHRQRMVFNPLRVFHQEGLQIAEPQIQTVEKLRHRPT